MRRSLIRGRRVVNSENQRVRLFGEKMADSAPSQGDNRRAIRNVAGLTAVFLASLWGFFGYWAVSSRQDVMSATENGLLQMTHAVEQYAGNVVKMAEIIQAAAEHWLAENRTVDPLTDQGFASLIEDFRKRTGELIDIRLIASNGDLYALPGIANQPLDNVADREYFQAAMRAPPGKQHIGVPVVSRVTGQWRLPITTQMIQRNRGFAVMNASVNLSEMIDTFELERRKPRGSISLWRDDGVLLARAPHDDETIGKPLAKPGSLHLEMITRNSEGFFLWEDTPVDGAKRFVSYRRIGDLPIVILVTANLDDTLEPWRRQVIMVSIALVFVTVWGALFSGQLVDALRRLARLATVDALTALSNRRHLMESGTHELARMRRYGSPMALMILDVDDFKRINDTWGHPTGDRVLQALAQVMNDAVRDQDTVGRLGGEEFAVILPETDQAGAAIIAERIRAAVQDSAMATTDDGTPVRITVSIGVTTLASENDSFEAALVRADNALYRAKEGGRNQVMVDQISVPAC